MDSMRVKSCSSEAGSEEKGDELMIKDKEQRHYFKMLCNKDWTTRTCFVF